MKKIILTVLVCAVVVVAMSISAFAAIGDVLGYAKYTDIAAYINNYPITSYNINDYTVIVVEDLRNYGFDVTWNGDARTLTVVRNGQTEIAGKENVYKYSYKAGQNSFAYVETDIVTYVNGQPVTSYNIGGQTCIYIDALSIYGGIEWNQDIRAIKLGIYDLPVKEFAPIPEVPVTTMYASDGRTMVVENTEIDAYKQVGWITEAEHQAAEREKMKDVYAAVLLRQYRAKMKDPSSFKLNAVYAGFDSSLYSNYDFVAIVDVSGKNSFGGITRSVYTMLLKVDSGKYILDLKGYADNMADGAWGSSKIQWMDIAINALKAQKDAASKYTRLDTDMVTRLVLS